MESNGDGKATEAGRWWSAETQGRTLAVVHLCPVMRQAPPALRYELGVVGWIAAPRVPFSP